MGRGTNRAGPGKRSIDAGRTVCVGHVSPHLTPDCRPPNTHTAPKAPRPTKAPRAPKSTKAPHQGGSGHNTNSLTKLISWDACAQYPQYASPQASQGAFTFPIHGGACPVVRDLHGRIALFQLPPSHRSSPSFYPPLTPYNQAAGSAPDGVLSGVCGMNPYGGRQVRTHDDR